jgi:molybdopterin synthase sulfur carrier subunit
VAADGATVGEILEDLERRYGGLRERLRDEQGNVRRFVSLFVNSEDVRHLQALGTPVAEGDEIAIVPAIAGG